MWRDGGLSDLGTLGSTGAWLKSYPMDVNNRGVVVGASVTAQEEEHPFRWRDGAMTDLSERGLTVHDDLSDINDRGQLVGTRTQRAMLYR
jgi:probable HAF family extracellular repeat protein